MESSKAEQIEEDAVELPDSNLDSVPDHVASLENGWLIAGTLLFAFALVAGAFSWWQSAPTTNTPLVEFELTLDLNEATAAQLQALPDVGPQLAGRIVSFREEHGPFRQAEELQQVRGVGPITLAELRAFLVVNEQDAVTPNQSDHSRSAPRLSGSTPHFPTSTPPGENTSQ